MGVISSAGRIRRFIEFAPLQYTLLHSGNLTVECMILVRDIKNSPMIDQESDRIFFVDTDGNFSECFYSSQNRESSLVFLLWGSMAKVTLVFATREKTLFQTKDFKPHFESAGVAKTG
jgi:hypothetical protein